ncbi:MAG: type II toxin-antitoxin system VapC family toxin [Gemmatimonadetes bacterium]|nr:type II toxin-antitoxin system VapC family toxin [Gemmatimonadota bacterium]MYB06351.1 type II toxin-antitoxin system VapC family toxin [Gemmatimonadota bacterium]MYE16890.1 type II toxin-antitoxin system VapC family toxin [Gemmatimonadota bacterium]MYG23056.1 type II toxin-antitoxin system VapC family toxin [Gemmatimonadota bacterium]MYJ39903.1 type II toxin-antitoxin system VapC family toxin [Gemmatimonadota bacterium]
MTLLLDTHIWIWSVGSPDRISTSVRDALSNPANALALSPVSVWETLLLAERGRVDLAPDPWSWVRMALATRPMRECPLTHQVALRSRSVRLPHNDPADRFIAATAMVHGLTLVTADRTLLDCRDIATLPAAQTSELPSHDRTEIG